MSNPLNCAGCRNPLPKREYLCCMKCEAVYDLDCANVSPKLFELLERKEQWKCPECKSKLPKTGNINTPVRNTTPATEKQGKKQVTNSIISPDGKSDCYVTHRVRPTRAATAVEPNSPATTDFTANDIIAELKVFMRDLISNQTDSLRETIADLMNSITKQNVLIKELESRVCTLERKSNEKIPCDFTALESTISQLQAEISDRDQAMLANDVEIAGCPESTNENCTHLVLTIAKKIGVELDVRDIVRAERAGPPRPIVEGAAPPRPRPLAVSLARQAPRDALMRAARVRRALTTEGLQIPGPVRSIYVNERLTKHNRMLFLKARQLARDLKFEYVWTRDGKIFVRKEHGKKRDRLRSESDLLRVFGKLSI